MTGGRLPDRARKHLARLRAQTREESGRVLVLSIGALAVAAMLVAVVATASAVYLDRKALLSLADATAAHAAAAIDQGAYLSGDLGVTDGSVDAAALEFLQEAPDGAAVTGLQASVTADGAAEVTLSSLSRPEFLPWVLAPWSDGIAITVTGRANAS
ncbi:glycosyltransferase [Serinibacter salmoneus]|uniref:Flp pilus-assembly TadE/G-like protein n=1 Tax=Serinibacter salmoneus TaxID=556530 RepID=A0A2A9D022_9MICO|nr:glycosyltransferase [Serinibacter salmoneus]PFG19189.1 hypothetical protein ATL40_0746 [Serinibacter salmoneus]